MARLFALTCALVGCSPSQIDEGGPTERAPTERAPTPEQARTEPAPSLAPPRPTFDPTTPCVEPPRPLTLLEISGREANPRPHSERSEPLLRRYEPHEGQDLDGDGRQELFVPEVDERACPDEVRYAIYVMRGDCGHRVGTVLGSMPRAVERGDGALDDLIVEREWTRLTDLTRPPGPENVATHFRETVRYRFDGETYVRGEAEVTRGICHHCALLRCRRMEP